MGFQVNSSSGHWHEQATPFLTDTTNSDSSDEEDGVMSEEEPPPPLMEVGMELWRN